jgi:hypothetical protein
MKNWIRFVLDFLVVFGVMVIVAVICQAFGFETLICFLTAMFILRDYRFFVWEKKEKKVEYIKVNDADLIIGQEYLLDDTYLAVYKGCDFSSGRFFWDVTNPSPWWSVDKGGYYPFSIGFFQCKKKVNG